jgi:hypothetical protein
MKKHDNSLFRKEACEAWQCMKNMGNKLLTSSKMHTIIQAGLWNYLQNKKMSYRGTPN